MPLMGISAYARHRGCALGAVQYAIDRGRIERRPDGLIDSETADQAWERNTMHSNARYGKKGPRKPKPSVEEVAAVVGEESAAMAAAANVRVKAGLKHRLSNAAKRKAEEVAQTLEAPERQGSSLDFSKARAAREIYDAKIKKLDYEERLKTLVSRKEVEDAAFTLYRSLRDACLNIPNRLAAQVASETDESVVYALMESEVKSVFSSFSEGRIG